MEASTFVRFQSFMISHPLLAHSSPPQRFGLIDGLRGCAALAVVIHHIIWFSPWDSFGSETATEWVYSLGYWGKCGVPVFFVISGFVIAHSLRKALVTPSFVLNFFVRRSMRLDPPYWCAIATVLLINLTCLQLSSIEAPSGLPTLGQLVAHVFYLQNILGYENISVGFWTLCIEIQFYMLFVIMLGAAQYLSKRHVRFVQLDAQSPNEASAKALIAVFAPIMFASLFTFTYFEQLDDWFLRYYCLFCLGACLSATHNKMLPKSIAWIALALFAIRIGIEYQRGVFSALLVGLLITLAEHRNTLNSWLMSRTWQYLGRISYSLYLIHYPVAHLVMHLGKRYTGNDLTMIFAWMLMSIVASIAAAEALYRLVEAPSLALAQAFGRRTSLRKSAPIESCRPAAVDRELEPLQV